MELQKKTASLIALMMAVFLSILLVLSLIVIRSTFLKLERKYALENLVRLKNAVASQMDYVEAKSLDWGAWDTPYLWLVGKAPNFPKETLNDQSAMSMKVDHTLYFRNDKRLAGEIGWDYGHGRGLRPPRDLIEFLQRNPNFSDFKDDSDRHRGFAVFPSIGACYIVTQPVVRSDLKGPRHGYVAFVKKLDAAEVKRLADVTKLRLSFALRGSLPSDKDWQDARTLTAQAPNAIHFKNRSTLVSYQAFTDFSGRPDLLFKIEEKRGIMSAGETTVMVFLAAATVFGALVTVIFGFLIRRFIVSRITRLTTEVTAIGSEKDAVRQVTESGQDEIKVLAQGINGMLTQIDDKNRTIQGIIENVNVGLCQVDTKGHILPGHSTSLYKILDATQPLDNQDILEILFASPRDRGHFQVLLEQVMEDPLLADILIAQLPDRIKFGEKTLGLHAGLIKKDDKIEGVLFTIEDLTDLVKAETTNELNSALLKILKRRDHFADLMRRVSRELESMLNPESRHMDQLPQIKRMLHTWKGDFAAFGLAGIVSSIHRIEEEALSMLELMPMVEKLSKQIWTFIQGHADILVIDQQGIERQELSIDEARLDELARTAVRLDLGDDALRTEVLQFVQQAKTVSVARLLANLVDGANELAKTLHKQFRVELRGGEVQVPRVYATVFQSFIHLIRNAADHGIEPIAERGSKPKVGLITINVMRKAHAFYIVVADDGRGIDLPRLREKALEQRIVTDDSWPVMTRQEQLNLVFHPGMTTALRVTEISGRGIGLDALKAAIEDVQGRVAIDTRTGFGTEFTIELPLEPGARLPFSENREVRLRYG